MKSITKHKKNSILTPLLLVIGLTLLLIIGPFSGSASSLSGSSFQKDRIIDDGLFYSQPSMSVSSIQKFLDSKVSTCDTNGSEPSGRSGYPTRADWGRANGAPPPYKCLKSHLMGTKSKSASSGLCSAMSAKTGQSAARIIYDVSKACGIDAKVLLVMLQKEQSLITDEWPWPRQYEIAMGYGCPDTAPCSSQYYGFFNQVYNAARQLKNYRKNPHLFNYADGRTSFVAYHPDADRCGGTNITMRNAATAGLYNYTPYQPNGPALSNLYGTGNSCSAYGNRNFWRLYNDWFGSTQKLLNYRLIECDDTKYLVERYIAVKREITDRGLREWGLENSTFAEDDRGCDYPTFSLELDIVAQSRNTHNKYLLNKKTFFLLQSGTIAEAWGLNDEYNAPLGDTPMLEGKTLNDLTVQTKLPRLAKSSNTGKVYLLDGGEIHHISGTPDDETYLKLVRGYGEIPMSTISGEYLSELKTLNGQGGDIESSFSVDGRWYLFDFAKARTINPIHIDERWAEVGTLLNGPELSADVPKVIGEATGFGKGFKRLGTYYVVRVGGELDSTRSENKAEFWSIESSPSITNSLFRQITNQ